MPIAVQEIRGHKYAKYIKSVWDKEAKKQKKEQIHLGIVVDLDKNIFRDRQGLFGSGTYACVRP